MTIVSYARWRAWWAIFAILAVIAFFAWEILADPVEFKLRFQERPTGLWIGLLGAIWWTAVLWPDAFKLLFSPKNEVVIADGVLELIDGRNVLLGDVNGAEVERRFFRHSTVLLTMSNGGQAARIATSFQSLSSSAKPESIAHSIIQNLKASN